MATLSVAGKIWFVPYFVAVRSVGDGRADPANANGTTPANWPSPAEIVDLDPKDRLRVWEQKAHKGKSAMYRRLDELNQIEAAGHEG